MELRVTKNGPHATEVSRTAEGPDEIDAAWLSFTRPLVRLGFASGVDITVTQGWWDDVEHMETDAITAFMGEAIEADRKC